MLVSEAADRGQLQKTDLLEKWFPDFPNSGKITVDDLLRMRSGIAAESDEEIVDAVESRKWRPKYRDSVCKAG